MGPLNPAAHKKWRWLPSSDSTLVISIISPRSPTMQHVDDNFLRQSAYISNHHRSSLWFLAIPVKREVGLSLLNYWTNSWNKADSSDRHIDLAQPCAIKVQDLNINPVAWGHCCRGVNKRGLAVCTEERKQPSWASKHRQQCFQVWPCSSLLWLQTITQQIRQI